MIIYLASYPRSGNFWLQNLLANQFKRLTTDIHYGTNNPNILEHRTKINKSYYDIDIVFLDEREIMRYGELSKWMIGYKSPMEEKPHKGILPGCFELLKTVQIRNILSQDQETYFLKTHFYPQPGYMHGEYVIQIVRHPGACLWSYYNFKRDLMKNYDTDLSSLIKSDYDYGSWSQYHQEWARVAQKLGSRYLLVRYEDLFGKELEFCKKLQSFLNLSVLSDGLRSFDFYHSLRPTLTREGKADGWEKNYSKNQLKLLWKTHRKMMTRFGYQEPNYDLGMDNPHY
jgi:hypothetical protein